MTKSMTKRLRKSRTSRSSAIGRVSTQRVTARGKRGRRRNLAAVGSNEARAAAETLQVTFDLRDVAGLPISDPETFFTFRRLSDRRQIADQVKLELTGAPVVFALPVATGEVAVCEIDMKRFRFVHSPVFFRTPGPPITKQCQLFREPKEWTPRFTRWNDLAAQFGDLKRVLTVSPRISLFKEANPIAEFLVEFGVRGDVR